MWLPEGYGTGKRYNVIYMHDGLMLFDPALPPAALDDLHRKLPPPGKRKIYSDHGGDPLHSLYPPTHAMLAELLRDRCFTDEQVMLRV